MLETPGSGARDHALRTTALWGAWDCPTKQQPRWHCQARWRDRDSIQQVSRHPVTGNRPLSTVGLGAHGSSPGDVAPLPPPSTVWLTASNSCLPQLGLNGVHKVRAFGQRRLGGGHMEQSGAVPRPAQCTGQRPPFPEPLHAPCTSGTALRSAGSHSSVP